MNIFVLDRDPSLAASYLVDSHVVKMPLETAQLLSTAVYILSGNKHLPGFYKPTHRNHPCAIWTRQSPENFAWLIKHGFAISFEFRRRFDKPHKSTRVMLAANDWVFQTPDVRAAFPFSGLTPFAQAMPEEFRNEDPVVAYRAYYTHGKRHLHKWRAPAIKPEWISYGTPN